MPPYTSSYWGLREIIEEAGGPALRHHVPGALTRMRAAKRAMVNMA